MYVLITANRNYSSWSLRPWVLMRVLEIPFRERLVPFVTPDAANPFRFFSPSGKVPCLIDSQTVVWDSLAICEYIAEKVPALWPADSKSRAEARSISAEMHSGFVALRHMLPMDVTASKPHTTRTADVEADIARIVDIWESCRSRFVDAGPFLFGRFTIADAMFAPVVWRFITYEVDLPAASRKWVDAMLSLPAMQEWRAGAQAETAGG